MIDPTIKPEVDALQARGIKTLASCCGHGKYPKTIVIERNGQNIEYFSGIVIPRKRRFYRKDSEGIYYIPEVSDETPLITSPMRPEL